MVNPALQGEAAKRTRLVTRMLLAAVLACGLMPLPAFAQPIGGDANVSGSDNDAAPLSAASDPVAVEPNEILIQYDDADDGTIRTLSTYSIQRAVEDGLSATVVETVAEPTDRSGTIVRAEVPSDLSVDDAVAKAQELPGVTHAQPNFRYSLLDDPTANGVDEVSDAEAAASEEPFYNDPRLADQYYLQGGWEENAPTRGANVEAAWELMKDEDLTTQGTVTIAVLDTGARVEHEDLKMNLDTDHMGDMTRSDANGNPGNLTSEAVPYGDNNGHGTHVCGIAAGVADNGVGVAGASGNATVLPIKVFSDEQEQPGASTSSLVKAYQYLLRLVDSGELIDLHVINMSLGGYGSGQGSDDIMLRNEMRAANKENILTVVAGGNGDQTTGEPYTIPSYPSDYDEALAVTALNPNGTNIHWSDYNEYKDISAPGYKLLSAWGGVRSPEDGGNSRYEYASGTSMASPLVAGIASLLWSTNPELTVDEARDAILSTAWKLDPNGEDYRDPSETGSVGAIDAAKAVQYVIDTYGKRGETYEDFSKCTVSPIADVAYDNGNPVEPASVEVHAPDGTLLTAEQDYHVSYTNNTEVGTAEAKVTGRGAYRGRVSTTFKIKYDVATTSAVSFFLTRSAYTWGGEAIEPTVVGLASDNESGAGSQRLTEGVDYTVAYRDNIGNATSTVTGHVDVTGIGEKYMGTTTLDFSIAPSAAPSPDPDPDPTPDPDPDPAPGPDPDNPDKPDPSPEPSVDVTDVANATAAYVPDQTYAGSPVTPSLRLKTPEGTVLSTGTDYTVTYRNNNAPGVGFAEVTGTGAYHGTQRVAFFIGSAQTPTFGDLTSGVWYVGSVRDAARYGFVSGYSSADGSSSGLFGPDDTITRGQVATILARAAGAELPEPEDAVNETPFMDVPDGMYYTAAVNWAYDVGVLSGYRGTTLVGPNDNVSREELAAMLANFAEYEGVNTSRASRSALYACGDYLTVDGWAFSALAWATDEGVMNGVDAGDVRLIDPHGEATRAQMAAMTLNTVETVWF